MDNEHENNVNPEHVPEPDPQDAELEALRDIVFGPSSSEAETARRMFAEGLVPAVESIVHLAAFSKNDRIRLDAAKYVTERNLGKVADKLGLGEVWTDLFNEITAKAKE